MRRTKDQIRSETRVKLNQCSSNLHRNTLDQLSFNHTTSLEIYIIFHSI